MPDGLLRLVQQALTGDASASNDEVSAEMRARLQLAVDSGGELLPDLRVLNGRGERERQQPFWAELAAVLEEAAQAAHDRRHAQGGASYLSELISLPELMRGTRERLEAKRGADRSVAGIDIPSEAWVALQFLPKDKRSRRMLEFTGRYISDCYLGRNLEAAT